MNEFARATAAGTAVPPAVARAWMTEGMVDFMALWIPSREDQVSASHVLHALDLSRPELEAVRAALESGDEAGAGRALVRYFHARADVKFLFDYRGAPLQKIDPNESPYSWQSSLGLGGDLRAFMLHAAHKMMDNVYVLPGAGRGEQDLGKHFETMPHFKFPDDLVKGHRHTVDMIVRGQFFESLAVLYHETGDRAVAEHFRTLLHTFFEVYPLNIEYGEPDTGRFMTSEDRDVMSAGWLTIVLLSLFYTELPYALGEDDAFFLLRKIWYYAMQFRRLDTDGYRSHNHHMFERGLVPFILSVLLPEFPEIAAMQTRGREIVCRHVHEDFGSHGEYSEHSIAYWSGAAVGEMLYRGMYIARLNGLPLLDEEGQRNIDRGFDVLALISSPDARYPTLGDNRGPLIDPILELGVRMTGNDLCGQVLKARRGAAEVPGETLLCDNTVGFAAGRDRWGAQGSYFLMSLKENCGYSGHNHMDMLSLFITVRGEELIGEPYSGRLYHTVRHASAERGFMYNMTSHNTVLAYGEPIRPDCCYANKWGVLRPDVKLDADGRAPGCMHVRAHHDAYTDCRHERSVLLGLHGAAGRSPGWLVRDAMIRGNRQPQEHVQRWFFTPGVRVEQITETALLLCGQSARLLMLWKRTPRFTLRLWRPDWLYPGTFSELSQIGEAVDVRFGADPSNDQLTVTLTAALLDVTERALPDTAAVEALLTRAEQEEWGSAALASGLAAL